MNKHKIPTLQDISHFFECCLGKNTVCENKKMTDIRQVMNKPEIIETTVSEDLEISSDMIVLDLINNFPQIKAFLKDLHPLGMLSNQLDQMSLEMFFLDQPVDIKQICSELTKLIKSK